MQGYDGLACDARQEIQQIEKGRSFRATLMTTPLLRGQRNSGDWCSNWVTRGNRLNRLAGIGEEWLDGFAQRCACDLRCNAREFVHCSKKSRPQLDIAIWGGIFRHSLTEGSQATGISGNWLCEVTDEIPDGWSAKPEGIRLLPHPAVTRQWGILYDVPGPRFSKRGA